MSVGSMMETPELGVSTVISYFGGIMDGGHGGGARHAVPTLAD